MREGLSWGVWLYSSLCWVAHCVVWFCPTYLGVFHQHVLSGHTDIAEAQEAVVDALVAKLVPYVPNRHPCKSECSECNQFTGHWIDLCFHVSPFRILHLSSFIFSFYFVLCDWSTDWLIYWLGEWVSGWVSAWVNEWMSEWVSEWVIYWLPAWLGGWVVGC